MMWFSTNLVSVFYEAVRVKGRYRFWKAIAGTYPSRLQLLETCMSDLQKMANAINAAAVQFSDRIAPKAIFAPWDAYERSNGQFSHRKFTDFMIPTANMFQLERILWQRHRLNFRPWGGNELQAPSCHTSFQPSRVSTPFAFIAQAARVIVSLAAGNKSARDDNAMHPAALSNTGLRLPMACHDATKARYTHRSAECCLSFSRRVFTHWRTVMNSRWSSNARHSLRVLLYAPRFSTYSISCGKPYTLDLHIHIVRSACAL